MPWRCRRVEKCSSVKSKAAPLKRNWWTRMQLCSFFHNIGAQLWTVEEFAAQKFNCIVNKWKVHGKNCISVQCWRTFLAFHRGMNSFCSSIQSKVTAEKTSVHSTKSASFKSKTQTDPIWAGITWTTRGTRARRAPSAWTRPKTDGNGSSWNSSPPGYPLQQHLIGLGGKSAHFR